MICTCLWHLRGFSVQSNSDRGHTQPLIHVPFPSPQSPGAPQSLFRCWTKPARLGTRLHGAIVRFVDACMLAGTEYCLTYPYLNLSTFQPQQKLWPQ